MPEIKIVTEVAGRVCATPVQVGGTVADGDEIVLIAWLIVVFSFTILYLIWHMCGYF